MVSEVRGFMLKHRCQYLIHNQTITHTLFQIYDLNFIPIPPFLSILTIQFTILNIEELFNIKTII